MCGSGVRCVVTVDHSPLHATSAIVPIALSASLASRKSTRRSSTRWNIVALPVMGGVNGFTYVLYYSCVPVTLTIVQGLWQGDEPFFPDGMQISETAISGHGARLSSSSLAIVEFILGTLPQQGTPAQVLFTYLQACFTPNPNHLEHFKCELDINRNDLAPHQAKLRKLARSLGR